LAEKVRLINAIDSFLAKAQRKQDEVEKTRTYLITSNLDQEDIVDILKLIYELASLLQTYSLWLSQLHQPKNEVIFKYLEDAMALGMYQDGLIVSESEEVDFDIN